MAKEKTKEVPYKNRLVGIYKMQSIGHPDRIYVGSAHDLFWRWSKHKGDLLNKGRHSIILQNHVNKYGIDDIEFEIIESGVYLDKHHLLSREQTWMSRFSFNEMDRPYFNVEKKAGSRQGSKSSEDTKRKISESKKGRVPWNKGMKYSHLKCENKSKKRKKKVFFVDGVKHFCKESVERMKIAKLNQSEETRRKNSEGRKQYWIKWRKERGLLTELQHIAKHD